MLGNRGAVHGMVWAAGLAISAGSAMAATTINPWWDRYERHADLVKLPDGRRINLYCEGTGAPVVILDAGLGAGAWAWRGVQDKLAKTTKVCAYDRAGYGRSDLGPGKRDTAAIVDDLEALLKAARLPGPYVMVGHSMGGYDMRLFAFRNRGQVAGLVLVDPASDRQAQRMDALVPGFAAIQARGAEPVQACLAKAEAGALTPSAPLYKLCAGDPPPDMAPDLHPFHMAYGVSPAHYRATLAEMQAMSVPGGFTIPAPPGGFGDLPLIVLTAGRTTQQPPITPAQQPAAAALWSQMHDEVAQLSRRGENRQVPQSGHNIQDDAPQAVIDAVKHVVAQARKR